MNHRRRNWILIALGIVIIFVVLFYALQSVPSCCAFPPTELTANSSVPINQTTEAYLNQTQTAAYATRIALTTTPTPIPYTADMSPTALPPPTNQTRTATPTLCPPSDVVCPGGNATANPAQEVMVLMASAKAPEFGQLAQTATALAITSSPSPTATSTSSVHDSNCAFSWAHQDLPEVAQAAQAAFSATDKQIEVLRADAYGENCIRADGSISYFGAMTTDFYLNANVTNLNNDDELAQTVIMAYKTLTALKVNLPATPGYLDMMLTAQGSTKHFRAMFYELKSAIDAGIGGESLLEIGGLR